MDATHEVTQHEVPAETMQAIVQTGYGPVEVLHYAATERPHLDESANSTEVLVRVHAAAMDRGTWHMMTGRPYLMRLMGFGFRRPKQPVAGLDLAGTVAATAPGVTRFRAGDAVYGIGRGSFAPFAVADEAKLARKPRNLSFEQAAACGVSGVTALQAVRDAGKVERGHEVLIIGASGGVGTFAVQLAVARGAVVTGVCSGAKAELVRSLGAKRVVDYTHEDFTATTQRYDVIIDIGGNTELGKLRTILAERGVLVFVGGEQGGDWSGGLGRQLRAMLLSPFTRQRFVMVMSKESGKDLQELADSIEAGVVRPVVDRAYPLQEVPQAMRRLVAGEVKGKLAITVP